jgi:hypothetical protein
MLPAARIAMIVARDALSVADFIAPGFAAFARQLPLLDAPLVPEGEDDSRLLLISEVDGVGAGSVKITGCQAAQAQEFDHAEERHFRADCLEDLDLTVAEADAYWMFSHFVYLVLGCPACWKGAPGFPPYFTQGIKKFNIPL